MAQRHGEHYRLMRSRREQLGDRDGEAGDDQVGGEGIGRGEDRGWLVRAVGRHGAGVRVGDSDEDRPGREVVPHLLGGVEPDLQGQHRADAVAERAEREQ